MVLETPSTKPARFGDRSMMFAQYPAQKDTNFGDRETTRRPASSTISCMHDHAPECDAMFMPSAAENNAAAARGVIVSPSASNTPMHTDGEAKATTCESFRAASGVNRLVTMKCSIAAAHPFPTTTLVMYLRPER